jgi:hypothetical protein
MQKSAGWKKKIPQLEAKTQAKTILQAISSNFKSHNWKLKRSIFHHSSLKPSHFKSHRLEAKTKIKTFSQLDKKIFKSHTWKLKHIDFTISYKLIRL